MTLFVKPRAQPRHTKSKQRGKHRVGLGGSSSSVPTLSWSFRSLWATAQALWAPPPGAGDQVWAYQKAPPSKAPRPVPDISAARRGPPLGLEPAPSTRQVLLLDPQGLPPASLPVHMAWEPESCLLLTIPWAHARGSLYSPGGEISPAVMESVDGSGHGTRA